MTLIVAQTMMATDWVAAYQAIPKNYAGGRNDAD